MAVALLGRGAARDAAARDRFAAAVERGRGERVGGEPVVVASDVAAGTPWAATRLVVGSSSGGERALGLLDPVSLAGAGARSGVGGPGYAAHWSGASEPSTARWGSVPRVRSVSVPREEREARSASVLGAVMATVFLLVLLVGAAVWVWMWFVVPPEPEVAPPPPVPSSSSPAPGGGSPSASGSGGESGPSPSPGPGEASGVEPSPGDSGEVVPGTGSASPVDPSDLL
ncbi:hypothetical protein [Allonocardiopsis opalescens]|uniref:hypothetical protein n=1 Tax=Allonocardiopsis opalescens TaxID=1144618 RepID=UPI0011B2202C|nr:hypothetical protein [Allonocardiopsis opalescens]